MPGLSMEPQSSFKSWGFTLDNIVQTVSKCGCMSGSNEDSEMLVKPLSLETEETTNYVGKGTSEK